MQAREVGQGLPRRARHLRALRGRERARRRGEAPQRAARDGAEQVEILEQLLRGRDHWSRRLVLHLPARLEEEERLGEHTRTQGRRALAPGRVELPYFLGAQLVAGDGRTEDGTRLWVGARHGQQVLHGRVSPNLALPHVLLNRCGELLHQAQPPGHPARTAVEAPGQGLQIQAKAAVQLREQPALFERRLRFGLAQRAVEDQGFRLVHRPHRGLDRVATQSPQGAHTLVAVDHHEAAPLARRHHHDRDLLAPLGQRAQQPSLLLRPPHPQCLVALVELVELQLQVTPSGTSPLRGPQACTAADLVFLAKKVESWRAAIGISYLRADLVFYGRRGMSAGFVKRGGHLTLDLVFRVRDHNSAQQSQKGSSRRLELVLRDVPREGVEGRQRLRRLRPLVLSPPLNSPRGCVVRIALAPRCLRRRPPTLLALRCRTGALPVAYSNVRREPATTEPARTTPAHTCMVRGSLLASIPGHFSRDASPRGGSHALGHSCRAKPVNFCRAPKP